MPQPSRELKADQKGRTAVPEIPAGHLFGSLPIYFTLSNFSSAYCPYRLPDIILYSLGPSRLDTSQFTNSHNCRFIFATSRDTQQQTNNHLREKLPRLFWTYPIYLFFNPRLVLDLQKTEFISRPTFAPIDSLTLSQSGPSKVRFIYSSFGLPFIFASITWLALSTWLNFKARPIKSAYFYLTAVPDQNQQTRGTNCPNSTRPN